MACGKFCDGWLCEVRAGTFCIPGMVAAEFFSVPGGSASGIESGTEFCGTGPCGPAFCGMTFCGFNGPAIFCGVGAILSKFCGRSFGIFRACAGLPS